MTDELTVAGRTYARMGAAWYLVSSGYVARQADGETAAALVEVARLIADRDEAVREERERCAALCEFDFFRSTIEERKYGQFLAREIRRLEPV